MDTFNPFHRRGEQTLEYICDAPLDILGHQSIISPDDSADGSLNDRKDIGRRFEHRHRSEHYDNDGQHHERVRPAQGNMD